jgi:ERCC4-type nuclease
MATATVSTFDKLVVCPFTIVQDTREQAGYEFSGMPCVEGEQWIVPVVCRGLKTGDYSIDGFEEKIAVERKSLEDLYGTLGRGRDRFEREFERLAEMEFGAVVIEATVSEIWRPAEFRLDWHSRLSPKAVEGTIVSWSLKYPHIHWWPMGSKRAAEIRTFNLLDKWWRKNGAS